MILVSSKNGRWILPFEKFSGLRVKFETPSVIIQILEMLLIAYIIKAGVDLTVWLMYLIVNHCMVEV